MVVISVSLLMTQLFTCLNREVNNVKIDLSSVNWGKEWILNINASKMKLPSYNCLREHFFAFYHLGDSNLKGVSYVLRTSVSSRYRYGYIWIMW